MKPVKGFEGLYSVTSCGRVYSHHTQKFLKQTAVNSKGILAVRLSVGGIARTCTVQKIVAEAYLPEPTGNMRIRHKDGNINNNCWINLEWCHFDGEHFSLGRPGVVVQCIETGEKFSSIKFAAEKTGVSQQTIRENLHGVTRRWRRSAYSFRGV